MSNLRRLVAVLLILTLIANEAMAGIAFSGQSLNTLPQSQTDLFSLASRSTMPTAWGEIEKEEQGQSRHIYVIKDAHANPEAQRNISNIIAWLNKEQGLDLVGLEGAQGELQLEKIRYFNHQPFDQPIAEYLLNQGELTGAEYQALTGDDSIHYVGVENPASYRQDLELYREAHQLSEQASPAVEALQKRIDSQKSRIYGKELYQYDKARSRFQENQDTLSFYSRELQAIALSTLKLDLQDPTVQNQYPSLFRLARLVLADEAVQKNHNNLQSEQNAFKEKFEQTISDESQHKDQILELFEDFVQGKALRMPVRHLIEKIYGLCRKNGILLSHYPALKKWIEFEILTDELRSTELWSEIAVLEQELFQVLIKTDEERELKLLAETFHNIRKTIDLELSGDDSTVEQIVSGREQSSVQKLLSLLDVAERHEAKYLILALEKAQAFYALARKRETDMMQNLLASMQERGVDSAVLVSGGFHADGIENMLKEKNYAYTMIAPKIDLEHSAGMYEKMLLPESQVESTRLNKEATNEYLVPALLAQENYPAFDPSGLVRPRNASLDALIQAGLPAIDAHLRAQLTTASLDEQTHVKQMNEWLKKIKPQRSHLNGAHVRLEAENQGISLHARLSDASINQVIDIIQPLRWTDKGMVPVGPQSISTHDAGQINGLPLASSLGEEAMEDVNKKLNRLEVLVKQSRSDMYDISAATERRNIISGLREELRPIQDVIVLERALSLISDGLEAIFGTEHDANYARRMHARGIHELLERVNSKPLIDKVFRILDALPSSLSGSGGDDASRAVQDAKRVALRRFGELLEVNKWVSSIQDDPNKLKTLLDQMARHLSKPDASGVDQMRPLIQTLIQLPMDKKDPAEIGRALSILTGGFRKLSGFDEDINQGRRVIALAIKRLVGFVETKSLVEEAKVALSEVQILVNDHWNASGSWDALEAMKLALQVVDARLKMLERAASSLGNINKAIELGSIFSLDFVENISDAMIDRAIEEGATEFTMNPFSTGKYIQHLLTLATEAGQNEAKSLISQLDGSQEVSGPVLFNQIGIVGERKPELAAALKAAFEPTPGMTEETKWSTATSILESMLAEALVVQAKINDLANDPKMTADGLYWAITEYFAKKIAAKIKPLYDKSNGKTGYVSVEVDPRLERPEFFFKTIRQEWPAKHKELKGQESAHGMATDWAMQRTRELAAEEMTLQARNITSFADNILVKVPATPAGFATIRDVTDASFNVTLQFADQDALNAIEAFQGKVLRNSPFISRNAVWFDQFWEGQLQYLDGHAATISNAAEVQEALRVNDRAGSAIWSSLGVKVKGDPAWLYAWLVAGHAILNMPTNTAHDFNQASDITVEDILERSDDLPSILARYYSLVLDGKIPSAVSKFEVHGLSQDTIGTFSKKAAAEWIELSQRTITAERIRELRAKFKDKSTREGINRIAALFREGKEPTEKDLMRAVLLAEGEAKFIEPYQGALDALDESLQQAKASSLGEIPEAQLQLIREIQGRFENLVIKGPYSAVVGTSTDSVMKTLGSGHSAEDVKLNWMQMALSLYESVSAKVLYFRATTKLEVADIQSDGTMRVQIAVTVLGDSEERAESRLQVIKVSANEWSALDEALLNARSQMVQLINAELPNHPTLSIEHVLVGEEAIASMEGSDDEVTLDFLPGHLETLKNDENHVAVGIVLGLLQNGDFVSEKGVRPSSINMARMVDDTWNVVSRMLEEIESARASEDGSEIKGDAPLAQALRASFDPALEGLSKRVRLDAAEIKLRRAVQKADQTTPEFITFAETARAKGFLRQEDTLANIRSWQGEAYQAVHAELAEQFKAAGDDASKWAQVEDAWYAIKAPGTAGIRGTRGLGTNRINVYTLGLFHLAHAQMVASDAYNDLVKQHDPKFNPATEKKAVALGGDSRIGSYDAAAKGPGQFLKLEALINLALGIRPYVYKRPVSTPQLAFTVHQLRVDEGYEIVSGAMSTASHNSSTDNGNKPYKPDGSQSTGLFAELLEQEIQKASALELSKLSYEGFNILTQTDQAFEAAIASHEIKLIGGEEDAHRADILFARFEMEEGIHLAPALSSRTAKFDPEKIAVEDMRIVISPLHGVARAELEPILEWRGFRPDQITWVQDEPDPNFTTVKGGAPNPELATAREFALEKAVEVDADLILWADPDGDRPAIAAKRDLSITASSTDDYLSLNGNQQLAVLLHYLITEINELSQSGNITSPSGLAKAAELLVADWSKALVASTVVSGDLMKVIARHAGLDVVETLTGFKYIGDKIEQSVKLAQRESNLVERNWRGVGKFDKINQLLRHSQYPLFGGEESLGALTSDGPHDKDAIAGNMWFVELVGRLMKQGVSLEERLHKIYQQYGYFAESIPTKSMQFGGVTFSEAEAMQIIKDDQGVSLLQNLRTKTLAELNLETLGGVSVIAVLDYRDQVAKDPQGNLLFDGDTAGLVTPKNAKESLATALSQIVLPAGLATTDEQTALLQGISSFRHAEKETVDGKIAEALPSEDFLTLVLANGSKVVIRPSGTEPKVKFYLLGRGLWEEKKKVDQWLVDASAQLNAYADAVARERFPDRFDSASSLGGEGAVTFPQADIKAGLDLFREIFDLDAFIDTSDGPWAFVERYLRQSAVSNREALMQSGFQFQDDGGDEWDVSISLTPIIVERAPPSDALAWKLVLETRKRVKGQWQFQSGKEAIYPGADRAFLVDRFVVFKGLLLEALNSQVAQSGLGDQRFAINYGLDESASSLGVFGFLDRRPAVDEHLLSAGLAESRLLTAQQLLFLERLLGLQGRDLAEVTGTIIHFADGTIGNELVAIVVEIYSLLYGPGLREVLAAQRLLERSGRLDLELTKNRYDELIRIVFTKRPEGIFSRLVVVTDDQLQGVSVEAIRNQLELNPLAFVTVLLAGDSVYLGEARDHLLGQLTETGISAGRVTVEILSSDVSVKDQILHYANGREIFKRLRRQVNGNLSIADFQHATTLEAPREVIEALSSTDAGNVSLVITDNELPGDFDRASVALAVNSMGFLLSIARGEFLALAREIPDAQQVLKQVGAIFEISESIGAVLAGFTAQFEAIRATMVAA